MMLDKKQIQAIFLFEFKTGHKAAEQSQLATSTMHLAQELIMSVPCSVVAGNFAKEMRALKMRSSGGGPSEVHKDQLRAIIEAYPLRTTQEVAKELIIDHSMIIQHLKQTGKVRELDKWLPHDLTENQKNHYFEVLSSLILCNNNERFLDQIVMCDEKWIYTTISSDQCSGWTEKKLQTISQNQTCTQKRSWSLFGGLLHV